MKKRKKRISRVLGLKSAREQATRKIRTGRSTGPTGSTFYAVNQKARELLISKGLMAKPRTRRTVRPITITEQFIPVKRRNYSQRLKDFQKGLKQKQKEFRESLY